MLKLCCLLLRREMARQASGSCREPWQTFWRDRGTLLLVVAVLASAGCAKRTQPQAAAPPSSEVFVANAIQEDVPIYSEWIGTTEGNVNAQIRPRVQGYLQLQHYDEGSFVQAGALLFPIDPVGEQVGSLWIIKGGLKPGERVVVAGLQKVQPGIKVVAKEAPAAPENAVASAASPGT